MSINRTELESIARDLALRDYGQWVMADLTQQVLLHLEGYEISKLSFDAIELARQFGYKITEKKVEATRFSSASILLAKFEQDCFGDPDYHDPMHPDCRICLEFERCGKTVARKGMKNMPLRKVRGSKIFRTGSGKERDIRKRKAESRQINAAHYHPQKKQSVTVHTQKLPELTELAVRFGQPLVALSGDLYLDIRRSCVRISHVELPKFNNLVVSLGGSLSHIHLVSRFLHPEQDLRIHQPTVEQVVEIFRGLLVMAEKEAYG